MSFLEFFIFFTIYIKSFSVHIHSIKIFCFIFSNTKLLYKLCSSCVKILVMTFPIGLVPSSISLFHICVSLWHYRWVNYKVIKDQCLYYLLKNYFYIIGGTSNILIILVSCASTRCVLWMCWTMKRFKCSNLNNFWQPNVQYYKHNQRDELSDADLK